MYRLLTWHIRTPSMSDPLLKTSTAIFCALVTWQKNIISYIFLHLHLTLILKYFFAYFKIDLLETSATCRLKNFSLGLNKLCFWNRKRARKWKRLNRKKKSKKRRLITISLFCHYEPKKTSIEWKFFIIYLGFVLNPTAMFLPLITLFSLEELIKVCSLITKV